MKKTICLILFITGVIASCNKEEIGLYQDDPNIYFTTLTYTYSFLDDIGATEKTIYLYVRLSGMTQNHDRSFEIEPILDTTTTAKSDWYVIGEGLLPAGAIDGRVPITLRKNEVVDTSNVVLRVRLKADNQMAPILTTVSTITWTGQIIQPSNWSSWLRYYFGTPFSTGWFLFICEVTGRTSFPYHGTLAASDPETWWMSAGELQAWAQMVKEALNAYNAENPGNELRHNDGASAGQLVQMP